MANPNGLLIVPVGFRADGSIHALELDNSDRLKVVIDSITSDLSITQTDASKLLAGVNGWTGSAWHKLLVDGSDRLKVLVDSVTGTVAVHEQTPVYKRGGLITDAVTNTSLAAGQNILLGSAVPSNKLYIIKSMNLAYVGTITGVSFQFAINLGSDYYYIQELRNLGGSQRHGVQCDIPLSAGWKPAGIINGATLNDDGYFTVIYEEATP